MNRLVNRGFGSPSSKQATPHGNISWTLLAAPRQVDHDPKGKQQMLEELGQKEFERRKRQCMARYGEVEAKKVAAIKEAFATNKVFASTMKGGARKGRARKLRRSSSNRGPACWAGLAQPVGWIFECIT